MIYKNAYYDILQIQIFTDADEDNGTEIYLDKKKYSSFYIDKLYFILYLYTIFEC